LAGGLAAGEDECPKAGVAIISTAKRSPRLGDTDLMVVLQGSPRRAAGTMGWPHYNAKGGRVEKRIWMVS
jgi:hypothetical protein